LPLSVTWSAMTTKVLAPCCTVPRTMLPVCSLSVVSPASVSGPGTLSPPEKRKLPASVSPPLFWSVGSPMVPPASSESE